MSPAIKFTGNAPLMAEGQKESSRDTGGAAFARFMLCQPNEGAVDPEQAAAATPVVVDDLPAEDQGDEFATDEESDAVPLLPPDAAPELLPMTAQHDLLPAVGSGQHLFDGSSDGVAMAGMIASPDGQPAEVAVRNEPAQGIGLQGVSRDGSAPGMKPGQASPASGVGFDAAGRLRVEAVAAPRPVEAPDPDQMGEAPEIAVEIRIHAGVEAKGDVATALSPTLKGAPHAAHNVVRQIAPHLADQQAGQIEVTLTPEELGTVRLVISAGDRPAIAVYAENSATLDLLRRHADLLSRELRDTGLAGAELSFADNNGTGQRQTAGDRRDDVGHAGDRVVPRNEGVVSVIQPRPALGSLIDIRI